MKKITITIALLLVVALSVPAFAAGHALEDVPSNHWAYNAINKLVASGVVEGYPDGEFKGDKNMTRYEMAVMVSRALENIAEEQEALANDVDEMGEGLTTGQAEDVTAIVKSLMEKNTQDGLSDAQAEEVADTIDALTFELRAELKVLGTELDTLGKDMDELAAKVDEMDVPEDNIEFGMDVTTTFEVASYEDENANELEAAMYLWADGDALDLDLPTISGVNVLTGDFGALEDTIANDLYGVDYSAAAPAEQTAIDNYLDSDAAFDWEDADSLPAEKRFWQEYSFNINGNLGEAEFNLDVDTLRNVFSSEDSAFGYAESDANAFEMDTALLEVQYKDFAFQMGDLSDYGVARYFVDEEDLEGVETKVNYLDTDWTFLVAGYGNDSDSDVYGVTAEKELDFATVTGRLYQARKFYSGSEYDINSAGNIVKNDVLFNDEVTVAAAEMAGFELTEAITVGGELAFSNVNEADLNDILFAVNGEFVVNDALTVNGMIETVGDEFAAFNGDLEEDNDYNLFDVDAEYVLNENNTVTGGVKFVQPGDDNWTATDEEDKLVFDLGLENTYGAFTNNASVSFTQNNDFMKDYEERVIELGTEYAWNETTTLGADLVNKDVDEDGTFEYNYNYLKGTMDKELSDKMTWNTEAKYIMGEVQNTDGESNSLTTSLTVSF